MNNIDFVIPWVNSDDETWLRKKNNYSSSENSKKIENGSKSERFRDYGTLKFLIRSIDKFAPWVHKVFIVTDNQIPDWLNTKHSKIEVIDHSKIFPNQLLPNFNSNAIEFEFDKISGLSNNFVTFNDDLLIIKPVKPEDFFVRNTPKDFRIYTSLLPLDTFDKIQFNNALAINGWLNDKWPLNKHGLFSLKYGKTQIHNAIQLLTNRHVSNYVISHNAISFNKSSYVKAKKIWPNLIENTISHKFRTSNDVSIWLIRYLQLETGNFEMRSPSFSKYYRLNEISEILNELSLPKHYLICINDSDTKKYKEVTKKLVNKLEKSFPEKSKFEL